MGTKSFRDRARPFVLALRQSPFAWKVTNGPLRRVIGNLPHIRGIYDVADQFHPFDIVHGTDTGGRVPSEYLPPSDLTSEESFSYVGCDPDFVRRSLAFLPSPEPFAFIDLGCGKGRALLLASELPFRAITGADISEDLVNVAQNNALIFARKFPERTPIHAAKGDAGRFQFPPGDFVLFLYNPFGRDIMNRVVAAAEAALEIEKRRIFIVYCNPVFGACWDASAKFSRHRATTLHRAPADIRPERRANEAIVIWQAGGDAIPLDGCHARIVVAKQGTYAELEP
jgi:SAM-dependent methyltransferase